MCNWNQNIFAIHMQYIYIYICVCVGEVSIYVQYAYVKLTPAVEHTLRVLLSQRLVIPQKVSFSLLPLTKSLDPCTFDNCCFYFIDNEAIDSNLNLWNFVKWNVEIWCYSGNICKRSFLALNFQFKFYAPTEGPLHLRSSNAARHHSCASSEPNSLPDKAAKKYL